MADYYPAIARAVLKLEDNSADARQELYDRARIIIVEELRAKNSKISSLAVIAEQTSLEASISRVESEFLTSEIELYRERTKAVQELREMPGSIGKMLFGVTFNVTLLVLLGVIYIKGLALVEAEIIGYPMLILVMVFFMCLFAPMSWAISRKA